MTEEIFYTNNKGSKNLFIGGTIMLTSLLEKITKQDLKKFENDFNQLVDNILHVSDGEELYELYSASIYYQTHLRDFIDENFISLVNIKPNFDSSTITHQDFFLILTFIEHIDLLYLATSVSNKKDVFIKKYKKDLSYKNSSNIWETMYQEYTLDKNNKYALYDKESKNFFSLLNNLFDTYVNKNQTNNYVYDANMQEYRNILGYKVLFQFNEGDIRDLEKIYIPKVEKTFKEIFSKMKDFQLGKYFNKLDYVIDLTGISLPKSQRALNSNIGGHYISHSFTVSLLPEGITTETFFHEFAHALYEDLLNTKIIKEWNNFYSTLKNPVNDISFRSTNDKESFSEGFSIYINGGKLSEEVQLFFEYFFNLL